MEGKFEFKLDGIVFTGDILLFLPGREEIDRACTLLDQILDPLTGTITRKFGPIAVLPVYAALPFEVQFEIFGNEESGRRKVVVATNIAETSVTIDGIRFVVDTGLFKESIFDNGIETLKVRETGRF